MTKFETVNLPPGWDSSILGEIGEWQGGSTPSKGNDGYWAKRDYPWVTPKDMKVGAISDAEDYLSDTALSETSIRLIRSGALLLVTRSGILSRTLPVAVTKRVVTINQDLKAITPHGGIDADYLMWFCRSHERKILTSCSKPGTTVASINTEELKALEIPVPPHDEQHRIVAKIEELFSELDKGVESLKTARAQLKTYRQSLLKAAFEGRLTAQWRRDNADKLETADQLLQRIREEREARYRQQLEEWKAAVAEWEADGKSGKKPKKPRLANLNDFDDDILGASAGESGSWIGCRLGAIIDAPKYGTSKKCRYDAGDTPVLRIPNVSHGSISLEDLKYADFSKDEINSWRLNAGDFLLVRSNGSIGLVGTGALVREIHEHCLYAGYLVRIRVNPSVMVPGFLGLAFQSPDIRRQIERKGKSTSGVHNINSKEISDLVFPVFSLKEQERILSFLEPGLSRADDLEKQIVWALDNAEALRQSILKRAFEGKLVPQDPGDESASALLERIRQEQDEAPKPKHRKRRTGVTA